MSTKVFNNEENLNKQKQKPKLQIRMNSLISDNQILILHKHIRLFLLSRLRFSISILNRKKQKKEYPAPHDTKVLRDLFVVLPEDPD